ncbi:hypothetical protein EJB05_47504, partial [Eragrostis curvula]
MSATAVSSSLNPNAPLFIPSAYLQVEDFSPQWWDLVTTTAWFRDHWSCEHSHLDDMADELDAAALLPDDDDLFVEDDQSPAVQAAPAAPLKTDALLKALASPKGDDAPRGFCEKPRHAEKPCVHQTQDMLVSVDYLWSHRSSIFHFLVVLMSMWGKLHSLEGRCRGGM